MNRICPFCEKVVGNDPHIYFCKLKTTNVKSDIKFLFLKRNFPNISDKMSIEDVYKNKSLPDIKSEFDIDFKSFIFLLDYFGIKRRNISESSKLISQVKYKKTCNDKYGVDNVSKSIEIKEKKKNTFTINYGVDNIFKDENFKKWIFDNNFAWNSLSKEENRKRIEKQTNSIKKYWSNLTDEQKNKIHSTFGTSSLETKISEVLNNLSIPYSTQFILKGKVFDFIINNTKILIEVNGDYWHCNPTRYNESDVIRHPSGEVKVCDIWKKDATKREIAENNGYKVVYIWEDEIKKTTNLYKLITDKIGFFI